METQAQKKGWCVLTPLHASRGLELGAEKSLNTVLGARKENNFSDQFIHLLPLLTMLAKTKNCS